MDTEHTQRPPLRLRVLRLLRQAAAEAQGARVRVSQSEIARRLGNRSSSPIPGAIRELAEAGLIRCHPLTRGREIEVIDHPDAEVIDHLDTGEERVIDHPPVTQVAGRALTLPDAANPPGVAQAGQSEVIDHPDGLHGTHVVFVNNSSNMARASGESGDEQDTPPADCPNPPLYRAARVHLNAARPVALAIAAACPERSEAELLLALGHARNRRHDNPEALVIWVWRSGERLREELPQAQHSAPAAPPATPPATPPARPGRASERQPGQPESRPAIGVEAQAAERGARVARLLGPGAALDDELEALIAFDDDCDDKQVLARVAAARAARQQPATAGRAA